jgi:predicted ATPase
VGCAHPTEESEAETCFFKAIEIAQQQQAKSLELRAATSLARLWQQQALEQGARSLEQKARNTQHAARTKLNAAHKLLSEIYNWFTEGFDTKDLQEAKALLEELH